MAAYLIVRAHITDREQYQTYTQHAPAAVAKFGGRYIARGGETLTLEGEAETARVVIIEFPSIEKAKSFYHSPEYQTAKSFRETAGEAQFIVVDGYQDSHTKND